MSDTDDPKAVEQRLEAEKLATETIMAQYKKALHDLRLALQREAEQQALSPELDGNAHSFE